MITADITKYGTIRYLHEGVLMEESISTKLLYEMINMLKEIDSCPTYNPDKLPLMGKLRKPISRLYIAHGVDFIYIVSDELTYDVRIEHSMSSMSFLNIASIIRHDAAVALKMIESDNLQDLTKYIGYSESRVVDLLHRDESHYLCMDVKGRLYKLHPHRLDEDIQTGVYFMSKSDIDDKLDAVAIIDTQSMSSTYKVHSISNGYVFISEKLVYSCAPWIDINYLQLKYHINPEDTRVSIWKDYVIAYT